MVDKKTLWVFGDSFSAPFYHKKNKSWSEDYSKYLGYYPSCFGELLAKQLNMDLKNEAEPGIGNESIIDRIILSLNNIKDGDIVVIGWSAPTRWRYVEKGEWKDVVSPDDESDTLTESTIGDISINRLEPLYESELCNRVELVNKVLGGPNKRFIYHWTWYAIEPYNLINRIRGERIKDETKGELGDNHFSAKSHKRITKKIINEFEIWKSINESNPL